ncbi:MAG: FAD-binding protein [Flavobacteriales bacterium]|nr:FAD-binding protein [Flavobacteriales bacterium]MBK7241830.1 FAD-binding protein [Flavobacteriales bacterium]MBK9534719.1 FAD-binding protein [Flavobacteriales bacterium]MBP9139906.1 FAD-binding protein [Flavobacteriales bacterium]HQV53391.1 FAD-linked oxidase C-terminal domain-containing protein [Flavobacteriales bacterium]
MEFGRVGSEFLSGLSTILKSDGILVGKDELLHYGHDETEDLSYPPEVVVRPDTTNEVAAVVRLCSQFGIPVTPIGARTGLSGGALCVHGGVALTLDRMNAIIDIDERNLQVTVEPGVITQVLQEAVAAKGLYYAPDPSSRGSCTIGGNLAENAGGPRAVKYGVTRDFVLNLEVVLPSGEVIWTGANTLKNSTGYDLTRLIVGSEGTLGIITKAVLRLIPLPKENRLMLVPFRSATKACEAVSAVFRAGIVPSALEFMERDALDWTLKFVTGVHVKVEDDTAAHLLIEVDGQYADVVMRDCETILAVMEKHECQEVLFAETNAEKDALWYMRRRVGEAVKSNSVYKEEDTVVPRYELPRLLKGVKDIGARYGFKSVCYGHAGDGNLHVNIIKGDLDDNAWTNELPKAIREIFELTVSLGGTLSGEHGIGLVQRPYMDIAFNSVQLELMKRLKEVFDPLGIMNPGKVLP